MPRLLRPLFAVYVVVLVWAVLWKFHEPFIGRDDMREIKLIPFVGAGGFGLNSPAELIANLLLFVPLGVYLAALLPWWRWWGVVLVGTGVSVVLETLQYLTAVGSSDVADVLVNAAGTALGVGALALLRRRFGPRTPRVLTALLVAGTLFAAVLITAQIVSFPQMPDDGSVLIV